MLGKAGKWLLVLELEIHELLSWKVPQKPVLCLYFLHCEIVFCLRMVPDAITAASGGPLLYYRCAPFAILKPKNRKTEFDV
jgi:hypothetical protein